MKHIKLFEAYLNEAKVINIVKMLTPPMNSDANRGKLDTVEDLEEIKTYLTDPESFTDDDVFIDDKGAEYFIDDLIGKNVKIGKETILVNESASASGWSKAQLDKELKELSDGARDAGDIDDSMAFDIADSWISENPGVELAIKKYYNATDAQGFVANRIA
jgi:hypothetical protein